MKTIGGDLVAYFDVDDTLVSWDMPRNPARTITLADMAGEQVTVAVHEGHIESIRKHKLRGHTVVVWSAGGAQWAERVVRELDLVPYVDACLAKPTWHYDDLPANEILGKRVYLDR